MPSKGQSVSSETIAKIKEAKIKKLQSKFNWSFAESHLDTVLNNGSRNRKVKFITLREFKDLIIEGNSLLDIKKRGISKHLVGFYSNLCQGKIRLNKETFINEYNDGISLKDIAKIYKVSFEDITFLRQLYDVKAKGATFQHRKATEPKLTDYQIQMLYGSMMGDAKKLNNSTVAFKHSQKQKEYLLWKYRIFENIASENSLKITISIDKRSEKELKNWSFYCHANSDVETCISEFYKNGGKEVSQEILDNLTPFSIAVWYMDDGKTEFNHREFFDIEQSVPIFTFCTDSFSKKSCQLIKNWFKEKYGILTCLKDKELSDRMGYRIIVDNQSTDKFVKLIKEYILPMFQYKINYNNYLDLRKERSQEVLLGKRFECPLGVDFRNLNKEKQDEYVELFIQHLQGVGLEELVSSPNAWIDHVKKVLTYDASNLIKNDYINFCNYGNKFLMSHFPNFWKAKAKGNKSPKEIFDNKKYLSEIIRSILLQGYFPERNKILKSLNRYRGNKIVSGFMPCVAKAIYQKYCDNDSKILDFCAGYGGRLFGAMACEKIISYTGIEINFETYNNLHNLYKNLRLHGGVRKEVALFNQDSILGMKQFVDNNFDFCFTSPPYFDAEEYSEEDSQSFKQYSRYSDWFDLYLISSIQEARRVSKKVAINIANIGGYLIADDLEQWLKENNIDYIKDQIRMPQYGGNHKFDPIFVF